MSGKRGAERLDADARVRGLDIARAGAIVGVVVLHAAMYGRVEDAGSEWLNVLLTSVRMPLLMTVSGILAASLLRRSPTASRDRALDLSWLLLCWFPLVSLARRFGGPDQWTEIDLFDALILPNHELWFIWALALLTGSLPLIRRAPRTFVVLPALLLAWLVDRQVIVFSSQGLSQTARYAVFFYAGLFAREPLLHLVREARAIRALALLGAAVAARKINALSHDWLGASPGGLLESGADLAVCLSIAGLLARTPLSAPLAWLGRRTLPIYLMHTPLILAWIEVDRQLSPAALAVLAPAVILLSLAVERVMERSGAGWMFKRPGRPPQLAVGLGQLRDARFRVPLRQRG